MHGLRIQPNQLAQRRNFRVPTIVTHSVRPDSYAAFEEELPAQSKWIPSSEKITFLDSLRVLQALRNDPNLIFRRSQQAFRHILRLSLAYVQRNPHTQSLE